MRKLKIDSPGEKQRIVWREILRSAESRYDHRLHGVLAVCRGLSCYEAAAVWGRSPRAVENWVRRFHDDGMPGLREKRRPGRPAILTEAQGRLLDSDLRRGPEALGLAGGRWSGRLLRRHLSENYGASLGLRQCQRLIKRRSNGGE